jgi:ribonuclease BN (tRNA processing enzyme)
VKSPVNITVLGAGDAFGSHGRFQASYLVSAANKTILMDAGPTVLPSMKRLALAPNDIDLILISHLHGDHFNGLGYLILDFLYESQRRRSLTIAGPPGLEQRTWALFRALFHEFDFGKIKSRLKFVSVLPNRPVTLDGVKLQAIRTPHTIKDISLAFRFDLNGKTIVFSGDTGWTEELVGLTTNSDLFLCECTFFKRKFAWHLNYQQVNANRHRFGGRRMVITHLGRELLEHQSEVDFEMAFDGMNIEV